MDNVVEVIKEGEIVRMFESRALEEDLFILRKVITPESREPEVERPRVPIGTKYEVVDHAKSYSRLERWRAGKLNYGVNNVVKDLTDNFRWEITRGRRRKGISRKELADAIGASEEEIKMMELGDLPKDDFVLINKIENHLGINLRKEKRPEEVSLVDLQKHQEEKEKQKEEDLQEKGKENISGDEIEIIE